MKINWFHLMPYRWLPDDFREKYRSVWVDIPSSLWDSRKGHHLYNEYLDELEFAEQMGVDGICVNEHHGNGYGLMPSPNIMAACLARRTSRANCASAASSACGRWPGGSRRGRRRDSAWRAIEPARNAPATSAPIVPGELGAGLAQA